MVGKVELGRTIVLPVLAMMMMHLRVVQVTDAQNRYAFGDYLGTRILTVVAGLVLIVGIGLFGYGGETGLVILLWGLAKSIDALSDIVRGLFQKHERMDLCGISLILRSIFALIAVTGTMWYFGSIVVSVASIGLLWLLSFVFYDLVCAYRLLSAESDSGGGWRYLRPRFEPTSVFELLGLALPLGILMFLANLQSSVPRGVLEAYHGEAALGYFGPIIYPLALGAMVTTALGQSASPRLAQYYVNNIAHFRRLMEKLLLLAVFMAFFFVGGVVLIGKQLLGIIYTVDYAQFHHEFIIVSVGAAIFFLGSFCGYGLSAARKFKTAMFLKIIPCLTSFLVAFWVIPSNGIRGAAITTLVVFVVSTLVSFIALLWLVKLKEKEVAKNR